jgi:hypothetical protein
MAIGIILGILVGLLSGGAFLVLIQAINAAKILSPAAIMTILAQLAIVPALWIGAPMLVAGPLHLASIDGIAGPYLAGLASSLVLIVGLPLLAWIRGMAGAWVVSMPEKAAK